MFRGLLFDAFTSRHVYSSRAHREYNNSEGDESCVVIVTCVGRASHGAMTAMLLDMSDETLLLDGCCTDTRRA
jgi:hypothetical protein